MSGPGEAVHVGHRPVAVAMGLRERKQLAAWRTLRRPTRGACDSFEPELRAWLGRRCPEADAVRTALVLNTAMAAFTTAVDAWDPDQPYDRFLELVSDCLRWAGAGLARAS